MASLRILLTPTEMRRPWIVYMTPGLMAAEVLHIIIVILFLGPLRRVLLPGLSEPGLSPGEVSMFKLIVYFVILFLSVLALAPLEVIATRLAIQRNHASPEFNSVSQEVDGDSEEAPVYGTGEEEVIGLVRKLYPQVI